MRFRISSSALSRLAALTFALGSSPLLAASWQELTPGSTTKVEVLDRHGDPARTLQVRDKEVLIYFKKDTLKGSTQTQIRVDTATGVVERIDVFPSASIDKLTIIDTYGPRCSDASNTGSKNKPCYVEKLTADARVYVHYPALGFAAMFAPNGTKVVTFVFTKPAEEETTKPPANATGTGTQTGTGQATVSTPTGPTEEECDPEKGELSDACREKSLFSGTEVDGFASAEEEVQKDPLDIGGQVYTRYRLDLNGRDYLRLPHNSGATLVDIYLDARPNERVRAMTTVRLTYDAFHHAHLSLLEHPGGGADVGNPSFTLDQMWLNFDLWQVAYLTIGKQPVKWGPARLWNPTDFLNPTVRNPLLIFDERLGTPMIKLHVPYPLWGWNFYAIGVIEPGGVAGSLRAEMLLGPAEVAVSTVVKAGAPPEFGISVSSPLISFIDVYAELAVNNGADRTYWRRSGGGSFEEGYESFFEPYDATSLTWSGTVGAYATLLFGTRTSATVGAEYFHNPFGYDDPFLYPWITLQNLFIPLYVGKRYAGLYANLAAPFGIDQLTLGVTTLGNLADLSFISRGSAQLMVYERLTLELSGQYHYGNPGEFNFGIDLPRTTIYGEPVPAIRVPAIRLGVGLSAIIKI